MEQSLQSYNKHTLYISIVCPSCLPTKHTLYISIIVHKLYHKSLVEASKKRKDNVHLVNGHLSTIYVHQWCGRVYLDPKRIAAAARKQDANQKDVSSSNTDQDAVILTCSQQVICCDGCVCNLLQV